MFTVENNKEDWAIPFLDTIVKPEVESKLSITESPPTRTNIYSGIVNNNLSAKYTVINTLTHRAKTVCNKPELFQKEIEHLRKACTHCKYPKWALGRVEKRLNKPIGEVNDGAEDQRTAGVQPTTNEVKTKGHIVIPYTQGLDESIKKIAVGMVYRPTSRVTAPSKTYWSPPRTRTPWPTKVRPSIGSNVGTLHVMMNI